jgi:DNA-binding XRE family transcriptional regulator
MVLDDATLRYTPRVPRRKSTARKPARRLLAVRPLGDHVRFLREERDLTQEQLAERAGISYKYLGRIELAQVSAGAEVLIRVARALGVPTSELFKTTPLT